MTFKLKFENGWIRTDKGFGPLPTLVHRNGNYAVIHVGAYMVAPEKKVRSAVAARHLLVELEELPSGWMNAVILEDIAAAHTWRQVRATLSEKCDELAEG